MIIVHKQFDIDKWNSCKQEIIRSHISEILKSVLSNPENFYYRGGFGREKDYLRLLKTGSDYGRATIKTPEGNRAAACASPYEKVGEEPWCRGLDPLYWALRGHGFENINGWNTINCLVAYPLGRVHLIEGDIIAFDSERPNPKSIEAIIHLDFDKSSRAFKKNC